MAVAINDDCLTNQYQALLPRIEQISVLASVKDADPIQITGYVGPLAALRVVHLGIFLGASGQFAVASQCGQAAAKSGQDQPAADTGKRSVQA